MNPLIVNVALTGMVATREEFPALPVTPGEIAADAARCRDAGAAMFHVHARGPDGVPTWRADVYADIVAEIRARCPDALICVSTSGRLWQEPKKRAEALSVKGIDMASLTLGSYNHPRGINANPPDVIEGLASAMYQAGILPELEIFDHGMLAHAKRLLEAGCLLAPVYANLFLGVAAPPDPLHLALMLRDLPEGATWAATGVFRWQFEVNCWAAALDGHVRVGLEDWPWMDAGKREPATNPRQVERIVKVGRAMGREPASPEQARGMLWNASRS